MSEHEKKHLTKKEKPTADSRQPTLTDASDHVNAMEDLVCIDQIVN